MKLVSVICLCYNHRNFVEQAVRSVLAQTYAPIEIIIVDDASKDGSVAVLERLKNDYSNIHLIVHEENRGMCRSFNEALALAKGEFIIDLAADDVMLPDRVEAQMHAFDILDESYGVVFSDAFLVKEDLSKKHTFYKRDENGTLLEQVPQGDIFKSVIKSYRICSPTIMVRRGVMDKLGGYDEALSYEDYDFFIRSSRAYKYHFIDKSLLFKRESKMSASSAFYNRKNNPHLESTLLVCKKALWLCQEKEEVLALRHSVRYHFRQAYFLDCFSLAEGYFELIKQMGEPSWIDLLLIRLVRMRLSVYLLYRLYRKIGQKKSPKN